mmetsp:Transcript_102896/g.193557  ORF Transcript_102896/g.193557 Transcript_102896/m.193557 type:complete len:178 (-) Transcript_102896:39-572(-)
MHACSFPWKAGDGNSCSCRKWLVTQGRTRLQMQKRPNEMPQSCHLYLDVQAVQHDGKLFESQRYLQSAASGALHTSSSKWTSLNGSELIDTLHDAGTLQEPRKRYATVRWQKVKEEEDTVLMVQTTAAKLSMTGSDRSSIIMCPHDGGCFMRTFNWDRGAVSVHGVEEMQAESKAKR